MKISKSILSPSHGRHEPPLCLPTSLSRRLKANGSIKGGQSPATFPPTTTGKKSGSGYDNPEPSSPKVTCIGQVKMKTKKKVSQTRRSGGVSFRKVEQAAAPEERGLLFQNQKSNSILHFQPQDRNQRWVHLPLTIYEALRDFSCLFPCRSSCFSTNEKEIDTKANGSRGVDGDNVVARWLVSLQDVEAEKMETNSSTMRRHVFEGVELKEGRVVEEEKGRVSICIPPKNALLLMRCRSDPMKMADITNRLLQSPTPKETDEQVEGTEELVNAQNIECRLLEETVDLVENEENNPEAVLEVMKMDDIKCKSGELRKETEQEDEEESEIKALAANSIEQVAESIVDQTTGNIQINHIPESEKEQEEEEEEKFKSTIEKIIEETLLLKDIEEANEPISVSKVEYPKESRKQHKESILPDCLLLMMCEPKLSMEVSKETWVCSSSNTDLQAKKLKNYKQVSEEQNKSQPPRSSCSFPAMSMATMIEHKLLNTLAYEPLVLTRCKSEPMRIATAKLEPGTCFWKNSKIEATFGFGAAGVGF